MWVITAALPDVPQIIIFYGWTASWHLHPHPSAPTPPAVTESWQPLYSSVAGQNVIEWEEICGGKHEPIGLQTQRGLVTSSFVCADHPFLSPCTHTHTHYGHASEKLIRLTQTYACTYTHTQTHTPDQSILAAREVIAIWSDRRRMEPYKSSLTSALFRAPCSPAQITRPSIPCFPLLNETD